MPALLQSYAPNLQGKLPPWALAWTTPAKEHLFSLILHSIFRSEVKMGKQWKYTAQRHEMSNTKSYFTILLYHMLLKNNHYITKNNVKLLALFFASFRLKVKLLYLFLYLLSTPWKRAKSSFSVLLANWAGLSNETFISASFSLEDKHWREYEQFNITHLI